MDKSLKISDVVNLGQTIQWPKEKEERSNNDLQNTAHKTKG